MKDAYKIQYGTGNLLTDCEDVLLRVQRFDKRIMWNVSGCGAVCQSTERSPPAKLM